MKFCSFPECVDDFGCFPAGDGDESEGGLVFQFIPHAVNLREFPLAIATGGNERKPTGLCFLINLHYEVLLRLRFSR